MEDNIKNLYKGLNKDTSFENQPEGTYTYALNSVLESNDGDLMQLSNEKGNILFSKIPEGYTCIGSVNIGDGEVALFSVKDRDSEIGILDTRNSTYTTWFNDSNTIVKDKLNFKIDKPIQAVYRLRRGCEKMVYWTDDYNVPRQVNLSNKRLYKNKLGNWDSSKFALIKNVETIPIISKVEVLENSGNLPPGSLSVLVQYSDSEKNFSRFVAETSNILIYKDSTKSNFADIDGSINLKENEFYSSEDTKKAIKISLENLDVNYEFYRLAFVHYSNNTLNVSSVYLTDLISVEQKEFVYTGSNAFEKTTREYLENFNRNVYVRKAKTISQKDNRLLLGNVSGSDLDFKDLQKLASKINVDCTVKRVTLNNISDRHNTKNPLSKIYGTGFIPGEVVSIGIVYVFEDGMESPVMHIPGKNNKEDVNTIYNRDVSGVLEVAPMIHSNNNIKDFKNNTANYKYTQRENCNNFDYWGEDSYGEKLLNSYVRHHRFPTRDLLNRYLVYDEYENTREHKVNFYVNLIHKNDNVKNIECKEGVNNKYCNNPISISFTVLNNNSEEFVETSFNPTDNTFFFESNSFYGSKNVVGLLKDNKITFKYIAGIYEETVVSDTESTYKVLKNLFNLTEDNGKLTFSEHFKDIVTQQGNIKTHTIYRYQEFIISKDNQNIIFDDFNFNISKTIVEFEASQNKYSFILGLSLSNIELPSEELTGKKCLGYYIVKQERREEDKTILDSGVILPMWKAGIFHAASYISPNFDDTQNYRNDIPEGISKRAFVLLSPRHKFHDRTFDNFTHIVEQGTYYTSPSFSRYTGQLVQNVNGQKTENVSDSYSAFKDSDGMSLKHIIRFQEMKFDPHIRDDNERFYIDNNDFNLDIYNLNPCEYASIDNDKYMLYNWDMSNKNLIFYSKDKDLKGLPEMYNNTRHYPYVYIYNNHNSFYSNFQRAKFYKINQNISTSSTFNSFCGDLQLGALRQYSTMFGNIEARRIKKKPNMWKIIGGALLTALTLVATALTAGATSALLLVSLGLLGATLYGAAAITKIENFNKAMGEHWDRGLKRVVVDRDFIRIFIKDNFRDGSLSYQDDTIRWYTEIFGDLVFETDINISLRVAPKFDRNNYLKPFKPYMQNNYYKTRVIYCGGNSICCTCNTGSGGEWYWEDNDVAVKSEIEEELFFLSKLCKQSSEREDKNAKSDSGWEYRGIPTPPIYFVNNDFQNKNQILAHYMTPIEYSFCSECKEEFPQRFMWSETSFSESLNDNFKSFLANNYKDLSGEYGNITNIFSFNNQLYIHTEEGLWVQPTNYQERVTNGVVTYIGTGEFGSLPAQLILDSKSGNSAGLRQRDAFVITPYGYFFVSEGLDKVFNFYGKLEPISDEGLSRWFRNNLNIGYSNNLKDNCPYLFNGKGYYLNYDENFDRILLTQRTNLSSNIDQNTKYDFTMSYNLKSKSWVSFHSYIPDRYIQVNNNMFTIVDNKIYIHNKGNYQEFYNDTYPFVIEYVLNNNPLITKVFDHIKFITKAYNSDNKEEKFITFNKAWLYTNRQLSGELNLLIKNTNSDYILNEVYNNNINSIFLDRNEEDWLFNSFRDMTINNEDLFITDEREIYDELNKNKYIYNDKLINRESINLNKAWYEQESFRDKYLVVRLIFDNFANEKNLNKKLVYYFSSNYNTISER